MTGKSHIVCCTSMLTAACATHLSISRIATGHAVTFWGIDVKNLYTFCNIDTVMWKFLGFDYFTGNFFQSSKIIISLLICFVFAIIGTLFPDCDSEKSLLGRIFHIPVEHHTLTHAIYFALLFLFIGYYCYPIAWFGLGWLIHEFMDSFSKCGNAYLYPIVSYRKYGGYAKVKKGIHLFKLYRTGQASEYIFVAFIITMCVIWTLVFLFSYRFQINIVGEGAGLWAN